jgi:sterol desaturase/sphingolipid hydroxylase (fatty acid hydroxylase superfamily)
MHHSKFKGNYGVHFRFWDRLMKTEFKDYEAEYDKIQERKRLKDG